MSQFKQKCQPNGCNRAASAFCLCCNKYVCTQHFVEHIEALRTQINPLSDEINTMVDKIQNLTIEKLTEKPLVELRQWKINMHQLIDEIFLTKTKEIEDLIEKNKEKFDEHKKQQCDTIIKTQEDIKKLLEEGDATFEQIHLLKNQLVNIEKNLTSFQNDFLFINHKVSIQELVTVSSNLDKPPLSQTLTSDCMMPPVKFSFVPSTTSSVFGTGLNTTTSPAFGSGLNTTTSPAFGSGLNTTTSPAFGSGLNTTTGFSFGTATTKPSSTFGEGLSVNQSNNQPLLFGSIPSTTYVQKPVIQKKK